MHAYVLLCNERNITVCCKFTQLHSYQILLKLVNIWLSYCENKKGELFFETQCIFILWTTDWVRYYKITLGIFREELEWLFATVFRVQKDALCTTNKPIHINPNYIMKYFTANHSNCRCQTPAFSTLAFSAHPLFPPDRGVAHSTWRKPDGHATLSLGLLTSSCHVSTAAKIST